MIPKKVIFFILLIGSTGVVVSTYAEPSVAIIMEKTTYTYCEKLVYSIEVSEITGDLAIIHIRDGAGGSSSAIPIPIEKLSNPIPSLHAFEKDIFPLGQYFIDVQYLGIETSAEFNLIDSDNMCISEAMQPVVVKWINEEGRPLERKEILEKSKSIFIKERTLADILKKLVLTKKIKRLRHGVYLGRCIRFYTYDNHVGESRWCVNCGQPESQHKRY